MYLTHLEEIKNALVKSDTQNYYKSVSSISVLQQTPLIFEAFKKEHNSHTGAILLDIYGLLQNLFVSIDALYDLSKMTMHYKYSVNVNQNETLRTLKYIRNDIVGHPTHRTYSEGGIGYSQINIEQTTKLTIYYDTHFFKKGIHSSSQKEINTEDLMKAFIEEATMIVGEVKNHLVEPVKVKRLSEMAYQFYLKLQIETFDLDLLTTLKETFKKDHHLTDKSKNRLLWRIGLLEILNRWQDIDKEYDELIDYLIKEQAIKIYKILCDIEEVESKYLINKTPELLLSVYRFFKQHPEALIYLKNLHDYTHQFYDNDLEELVKFTNKYPKANKLFRFLARQTDGDKVFLIGSAIQKFDAKKM